jgi:hypothetical protein
MELHGSGLLGDRRPGLAGLVISQRKLWKESVHLHGITTKVAILNEIYG